MHAQYSPTDPACDTIEFSDFTKVDIRVGTVLEATGFPEARKPSLILKIDFGPVIGVKKSSAQIAHHYKAQDLIGKKVAGVVNFRPRQIGPIKSEVLTLGFADNEGQVVLFSPDKDVPNGARLF